MKIQFLPFLESKVTPAEYSQFSEKIWPKAWFHCKVADEFWDSMTEKNLDLRFVCTVDDRLAATFTLARVKWTDDSFSNLPDRGWEWALETSVAKASQNSKMVSAFSMNILPEFRGHHLSSKLLLFAKNYLKMKGIKHVIAPVRPTWKSKYPLIPMEEYTKWNRPNGEIFDPWLRVHVRAGARIIKVCPQSMVIQGSASDWLEWTGVEAIAPGNYLIPEGLVPVNFYLSEQGVLEGKYVEPNVWVVHDL